MFELFRYTLCDDAVQILEDSWLEAELFLNKYVTQVPKKALSSGSNAVVYDIGNNLVLRVGKQEPLYNIPDHPLINQRIEGKEFSGPIERWGGVSNYIITFEVFPKVEHTITREEAISPYRSYWIEVLHLLAAEFRKDEIPCEDLHIYNVGQTDDGRWLVIDPGCFYYYHIGQKTSDVYVYE